MATAAHRRRRSQWSRWTASDRCRATAPMQPITLLVEEGNGKRRKCSLRLAAAVAIEEHAPPAATPPRTGRFLNLFQSPHSMAVSREPIASHCWLFVRMFETRQTSLELAVRASGSRTLLTILVSCMSNLILQSCYAGSCLLFGTSRV